MGVELQSYTVEKGKQLYANGYFVRRLTFDEVKELKEYETAIDEYNKMLQEHLIVSTKPTTKWTFAGRIIFPFEQRTMPRRPMAPSFCTAPDTYTQQLDGCVVQNYKIYIGSLFVRELDKEEKSELDAYNMRVKEYQDRVIESMKQKLGTMVSGVWYPYERDPHQVRTTSVDELPNESEGDQETVTSSLPTPTLGGSTLNPTTTVPLLQAPKAPKFCTQIF